ncbi:hypothetical protein HY745_10205 [Candidatus Desantisbacteria bacterium]|nr:hypothetical protein [Candidatus Desantisbacteria bacterium]
MRNLTENSIKKMVNAWYKKLDIHAPMVEILPMLSNEDSLHMVFPEVSINGLAAFESWYQSVIRIFFYESHKVKEIKSKINGNEAEIKIVVEWKASRWKPPAGYSDRIKLDAYQTWHVKWSFKTNSPVIIKYIVDELKYHEGSSRL